VKRNSRKNILIVVLLLCGGVGIWLAPFLKSIGVDP
jgi:hypothetical protein